MTAEIVQVDPDGVVQAPVTLFGTDDPVRVVERASVIATALADVIRTRRLFKHIGQSDHVFVEGWTLLGSMLGVFAEVEWSRPLEGGEGFAGWEARAVARTLAGRTVGAAESMCSRSESKWKTSDDYAVRSMAQTRAVSKALRLPLGFIMELAGYSATPAEEIPTEQPQQGTSPSRTRASALPSAADEPAPAAVQYRRAELATLAASKQLDHDALGFYADLVGIAKGARASDEQMDRLIEAVTGHGTKVEIDLPFDSDELPEMVSA